MSAFRGLWLAWGMPLYQPVVAGIILVVAGYFVNLWLKACEDETPAKMVLVAGGAFDYGSTPSEVTRALEQCKKDGSDASCRKEIYERELPREKREVSAFYIHRLEVTNQDFADWLNSLPMDVIRSTREFQKLIIPVAQLDGDDGIDYQVALFSDNGLQDVGLVAASKANTSAKVRPRSGYEHRPVTAMTWGFARLYCQKKGYRLPESQEWEYAARGPTQGGKPREYPWGNAPASCNEVPFRGSNCSVKESQDVGTAKLDESWAHVMDLGGNVSEWTNTLFDNIENETDKPFTCGREPVPEQKRYRCRTVRGGGWDSVVQWQRVASRSRAPEPALFDNIGFRCAKSKGNDRVQNFGEQAVKP